MKNKNNLIVYTALFGNYDKLIDPKKKYYGCKFICFTDRDDLDSDIWQVIRVPINTYPPNMMNRLYKLLPDKFIPNLGRSLYVDSNIFIKCHPESWIIKNDRSMQVPFHFSRNCIYTEAEEVIKNNKAPANLVNEQLSFYKMLGMPTNFGLAENNIIYRDFRDPTVSKLMYDWWIQINKFTQRDQLSLMFVLWINNYKVTFSRIGARGNKYFSIRPHLSASHNVPVIGYLKYSIALFVDNNPNAILAVVITKIRGMFVK
jgi:hypothetical protein